MWLTEFNKFYHPCNRSLKGYTRLLRGINENCRFGYAGNQCHNLECAQNKDGLTACCQNDFGCNKCTGKIINKIILFFKKLILHF